MDEVTDKNLWRFRLVEDLEIILGFVLRVKHFNYFSFFFFLFFFFFFYFFGGWL